MILQPSTLLSTLLQYVDLPTLGALRSLSLFRDRIAELARANGIDNSSDDTCRRLPRHISDQLRASSASEIDIFLRNCLTETKHLDSSRKVQGTCTEIQDTPPNASNLSKAMIRSPRKEKLMSLNRLGVLALASSPIATEIALQNLILQGVPGHDIDDKTKGRVYERIAKNEAASEATLLLLVEEVEQLASNGFLPSYCSQTFHNVALNKNASPEVLSKLLEVTSDDHTQQNIAKNPNASSAILVWVIRASRSDPKRSDPPMARRNVTLKLAACHPNTPSRYLQKRIHPWRGGL